MEREYLEQKSIDAVLAICEANGAAESFYELLQYIEKLESDFEAIEKQLKGKEIEIDDLRCECKDLASEISDLASRQSRLNSEIEKYAAANKSQETRN